VTKYLVFEMGELILKNSWRYVY